MALFDGRRRGRAGKRRQVHRVRGFIIDKEDLSDTPTVLT